jgi:hypothetical protein
MIDLAVKETKETTKEHDEEQCYYKLKEEE